MTSPDQYEKLGAFYLGKRFDDASDAVTDELILYDAKDLTTHAVCVGMTGSGKTGLCLGLLEEAAIDGIPTIAIDPKGDLGNLMLTFPKLAPGDFEPWIDPAEAQRKGKTVSEYAADRASLWKNGLASWGQDGARIQRLRDAADVAIYTPGGNAGIPLTVLDSFDAPPKAILEDADALRERVMGAVAGLLTLLGIEPDPIQSREHILLSNILQHAWQAGEHLDLPGIIHRIQEPPFARVGVLDLESFYGAKDRFGLAMKLNNLLASPGFAAWAEGEPLDIANLLWTPEGKPRIAILSIAHLSDTERMFFVTLLLNEMIAWMRTQPGTGSLRALLYMDEVFGYFPPTANPPSKTPMLTLLKQARAFGLGCVLATQNPVDLDYKGLSNCGTWFLGRLQTERDKMRVMEGLEGASASAGAAFDKQAMEETLARLGSRVFLMNNVHEDEPVLFHTRWVLSYLRGPLTRSQIQTLMADRVRAATPPPPTKAVARAAEKRAEKTAASGTERPVVDRAIPQRFVQFAGTLGEGESLRYRPHLFGAAKLHFVRASHDCDEWREVRYLIDFEDLDADAPFEDVESIAREPEFDKQPERDAGYTELSSDGAQPKRYTEWARDLKNHVYATQHVDLWKCDSPKLRSTGVETEREFRVRLQQLVHEERDRDVEKLRARYATKLERLKDRIRRAEQKVDLEEAQYKEHKRSTFVAVGETLLGAILGRRSRRRAATSARRASRAAKEKSDIRRAEQNVEALNEELRALEAEFADAVREVQERAEDARFLDVEHTALAPRKSDIDVDRVWLVWAPYRVDAVGAVSRAW